MICFKMFARDLLINALTSFFKAIRDLFINLLANFFKAVPALIMLILAMWLIAGVILSSGCSHSPKHLNPAPDFYLAYQDTTKQG